MVGRCVLLYVSLATLLLPTALADRAEDAAGDQLAPFPDQYDILAVDVRAAAGDLVVTFETAGSMRDGLSGWYAVTFNEGGRSLAVVCFIENPTLDDVSESCRVFEGGASVPADIAWNADGTAWTVTTPLAAHGLTAGSVLEDVGAATRMVVGSRAVIAGAQPVDLDTLEFDGPVRLAGN